MKKEEIRREFFKLKNNGFSYSKCRTILRSTLGYEIAIKTLKRWIKRLDKGNWDLRDSSKRPHTIHYKITPEIEKEVISLRNKTGWGQEKLYLLLSHLDISETSIKRIIKKFKLCRETKIRGKRVKWVRWQMLRNTSPFRKEVKEDTPNIHSEVFSRLPKWCQVVLALDEQAKETLKYRKK